MKRIPGQCPDCPVQTGYSQHSPGQTLFLMQKVTLGKSVNNIVCTPNYIRRSHYKVCHGTAWVEISFILFFQLVARRRILFLIDKATLEEIIYNIVCTPNYIRRSGFKVCHGTACVEYISYYFCNRLPYAELYS